MPSAGKILKQSLALLWPGAMVVRGKSASGRVAVTFDDGPHPQNTQRILDILDRENVIATFFIQGNEAEKYPELVREMFERGHQIGNHGYAHLDAKKTSLHTYIEDIKRTEDILEEIIGTRLEKTFRPPFGSITGLSFFLLAFSGYRFIYWSADSRDSFIKDPLELIASVKEMDMKSGDIFLFHEDYSHTVRALPEILQIIRQRGLLASPVSVL